MIANYNYSHEWIDKVYKSFVDKYVRATTLVLRIYKKDEKYAKSLLNSSHKAWWRFKKIVKFVNSCLELDKKTAKDSKMIERTLEDWRRLIRKSLHAVLYLY